MSVTGSVYITETEEQVCFGIEVRVPFSQAAQFAAGLTGNDNDIVLAAEHGIREQLQMDGSGQEVELVLGPERKTLQRELRDAARF